MQLFTCFQLYPCTCLTHFDMYSLRFPQLVCVVAISLNLSNVVGYTKCSKDAGKRIKEYAGAYVGRRIGENLMARVFSSGAAAESASAPAASGGIQQRA